MPNYIYANTINSNPIYADRAEHDADGNTISTTYATKSELPSSSSLVPASTSSDEDKVLTVNSSGTPVWATPSSGSSYTAGDGINIENNVVSVKTDKFNGYNGGGLYASVTGVRINTDNSLQILTNRTSDVYLYPYADNKFYSDQYCYGVICDSRFVTISGSSIRVTPFFSENNKMTMRADKAQYVNPPWGSFETAMVYFYRISDHSKYVIPAANEWGGWVNGVNSSTNDYWELTVTNGRSGQFGVDTSHAGDGFTLSDLQTPAWAMGFVCSEDGSFAGVPDGTEVWKVPYCYLEVSNQQSDYPYANVPCPDELSVANPLPASLGTAGQVLQVNSGATGVEWATPSGGGGSSEIIGAFNYQDHATYEDINKVIIGSSSSNAYKTLVGTGSFSDNLFGYNTFSAQTGFVSGSTLAWINPQGQDWGDLLSVNSIFGLGEFRTMTGTDSTQLTFARPVPGFFKGQGRLVQFSTNHESNSVIWEAQFDMPEFDNGSYTWYYNKAYTCKVTKVNGTFAPGYNLLFVIVNGEDAPDFYGQNMSYIAYYILTGNYLYGFSGNSIIHASQNVTIDKVNGVPNTSGYSQGDVLTIDSSGGASWMPIVAGSGIAISIVNGQIVISATGGGGGGEFVLKLTAQNGGNFTAYNFLSTLGGSAEVQIVWTSGKNGSTSLSNTELANLNSTTDPYSGIYLHSGDTLELHCSTPFSNPQSNAYITWTYNTQQTQAMFNETPSGGAVEVINNGVSIPIQTLNLNRNYGSTGRIDLGAVPA